VAAELAAQGAAVLVHGRDPEKSGATAREIEAKRSYVADLSSLAAVRLLAEEVERDNERLDVLVNNAGIAPRERRTSEDGYELGFAVNYLSSFLLTCLLLPLLGRSPPARVVNVSSIGQRAIDFDDVMLERSFEPMRSYAQSKLAQIMFTIELAERLEAAGETGVTVNALHPATLMDTKMVRKTLGRARSSVDEGAAATLRLVAAPELAHVTGRYFDGQSESAADPQAYDPDARRRLWELSCSLTGIGSPL